RPLRAMPELSFGTVSDGELTDGVRSDLLCWSSTRRDFRLRIQVSPTRKKGYDPFVVGTPVRVPAEQFRRMLDQQLRPTGREQEETGKGQLLCAYRVPIPLRAFAADGTPFDVGPFRRQVLLSSPDMDVEGVTVRVHGRVRGLVDIGGDEESGGIDFRSFGSRD